MWRDEMLKIPSSQETAWISMVTRVTLQLTGNTQLKEVSSLLNSLDTSHKEREDEVYVEWHRVCGLHRFPSARTNGVRHAWWSLNERFLSQSSQSIWEIALSHLVELHTRYCTKTYLINI
jgi:hypothetical protein